MNIKQYIPFMGKGEDDASRDTPQEYKYELTNSRTDVPTVGPITPTSMDVKSSAILEATRLRANAMGQLTLVVERKDGREPNSPLIAQAIERIPDQYQLLSNTERDLIKYGEALWVYQGLDFLYIPFSQVSVYQGTYRQSNNPLPEGQEIHFIDNPKWDKVNKLFRGQSPLLTLVNPLKLNLNSILAAVNNAESYAQFKKPIISVESETELDDKHMANLQALAQGKTVTKTNEDGSTTEEIPRGAAIRGRVRTSFLGANDDPNFNQRSNWYIQEVARATGVNPILLSDLSRATYSNAQALKDFYTGRVQERIRIYQHTINQITEGTPYTIKLDTSGISELQDDEDALTDLLVKQINANLITREAAARRLGIPVEDFPTDEQLAILTNSPSNSAEIIVERINSNGNGKPHAIQETIS